MGKILVVDDERTVLQAFQDLLGSLGLEVLTASNGNEAVSHLKEFAPDVVVSDLCMPGMNGLDAFRELRAINPRLPVIIMTGQGTMDTAIEATKLGAFDYQLKPFEPEAMVAAIERALESVRLMQRSVELNPNRVTSSVDALVGESAGMQEVFKAIGRVAATDATVLIRGESGTGKELVARAIYQHSARSTTPLVVVNCVAIPEPLLESELFGHEKGAFTGATGRKIGKFEQANQGTVFLDEIGDVSLAIQAKVLRVLQQRTFERVGSSETRVADVRIIAATNRNLERAIQDGEFREDLFHRLNVVTINIPPLRERRSDIPLLVGYFVDRYSQELGIARPLISDQALEVLVNHEWLGNVRQLEHAVYRILIFTRGYPIQPGDVNQALESDVGASAPDKSMNQAGRLRDIINAYLDAPHRGRVHERLLADVERALIRESLLRCRGNQSQAALLLGMTRPTLHAKIQRYGLNDPDSRRDVS